MQNSARSRRVKANWYDKLTFGGDFRLRYEGFNWSGHFDDGRRDRLRYRLRFGFQAQVLDSLALGFQLRNGNPQNPISDNQSFDDGFNKGRISIAEAYADWQPTKTFSVIVGKFSPTKLWTTAELGDCKEPGQLAVRFSRYDSKPDAIFFAYAQSDSRRSSNVDGYRTDLRIGMPKKGYVNVTWYRTNWTIGDDSTMDRWPFDSVFRF